MFRKKNFMQSQRFDGFFLNSIPNVLEHKFLYEWIMQLSGLKFAADRTFYRLFS